MNALTRWNPFAEMEQLENRLSSFLDGASDQQEVSTWEPAMDVAETADEYIVKADLPEVTKENLEVTLEGGVLTIAGERKFEEEKSVRWLSVERPYGRFSRSIEVPSDADASRISAVFKDGLLTIRIAKLDEAKPRVIEIRDR